MPRLVYDSLVDSGVVPEKLSSMFQHGVEPPLTDSELCHCAGDLSTGVKIISSEEELTKLNDTLVQLFPTKGEE